MDHAELRDLAKIFGGGLGAFVGAVLVRIGWKRNRRPIEELPDVDNSEPRHITRIEWHGLRDVVNKLLWRVELVQEDLARVEGKTDEDHERLSGLKTEMTLMRAQINVISDHCEHCPDHGPGRRGREA